MNNIKDCENLSSKRVLLRLDLNVPLKNGDIVDETRIIKIIPVIEFLIKRNAKILIISHVGRPKGKFNKDLSLKPICDYLEKKIKTKVNFISENILKIKRDKLNWKMTVKNDGLLPFNNTFPAIIEWGYKTIHPSKSLPKVDCELFHLSIYHPLVEDLRFNLKNLNDKRISFIQNNKKGIVAEFKTKKGNKILSSF